MRGFDSHPRLQQFEILIFSPLFLIPSLDQPIPMAVCLVACPLGVEGCVGIVDEEMHGSESSLAGMFRYETVVPA
jgi:hypothetical protein